MKRALPLLVICAAIGAIAGACAPPAATHQLVDPEDPSTMVADAFVYNNGAAAIPVRALFLADTASVECDIVLAAPEQALHDGLFDRASSFTLAAGSGAAVYPLAMRTETAQSRGCYAARVQVDDAEPVYVVWSAEGLPTRPVPVSADDEAMLPPGAVVFNDRGESVGLCPKGNVTVARVR